MFTKNQINVMARMQDAFNTSLDPNWKTGDANYYLAAAVETVEAIQHYGYAWWKAFKPDIEQVRMELVDIWHFMLSEEIRSGCYLPEKFCFEEDTEDFDECYPLEVLELNLKNFAGKEPNWVYDFTWACYKFNLTAEQLFKLYVGKNVLNTFRQNNGYKEGTYIKVWSGMEDNEHLTDIMSKLDMAAPDLEQQIMIALEATYKTYA